MAHDISGNVGNTPLLRLAKLTAQLPGVEIYAKAEYFNPGGSVKDRPALNMILDGERSGKLVPGKILIDSTSGNTGIAYAMLGASRGYKVKLCLPMNASPERKRILRAYGAELVLTPADEGSDGAIRRDRGPHHPLRHLIRYQRNFRGQRPPLPSRSAACRMHLRPTLHRVSRY
jgi:cysteine synthase B